MTWKYSKTKIGHNFLPELVRRNLNADLSLSVLRKKVISKIKIVNSDAFHNLILISGRCSCWRNDVRTCPQRRRRQREPTTSIQSNVRGRDVTSRTSKAASWWSDVTWRRRQESSWIGGDWDQTLQLPNQLRHFITIWFESYIVVSQAFNFR